MKKVFVVLLAVSCLFLSGCQPSAEERAQQAMDSEIQKNKREFDKAYYSQMYPLDTYCFDCEKFIEGKVRICPYCGQYVD